MKLKVDPEVNIAAIDEKTKTAILGFQECEITEHFIYKRLSHLEKNENNKKVFEKISEDELRHYNIWKNYTQQDVKKQDFKLWFYVMVSRIFGITFGIKLMEGGENKAQKVYEEISRVIPEAKQILQEETEHESQLIGMIDEEKLKYMGSVVLGLNDALVEFTGSLAGFTFALRNSKLIGLAGLIMGIAASLSMGASEYLSTKAEATDRSPVKASIYTGFAYVIAVILLIFPYFILENYYLSLGLVLGCVILLIYIFTFYYSVVKKISFKSRFLEMLTVSLGVATLSFIIGLAARYFLKIEI